MHENKSILSKLEIDYESFNFKFKTQSKKSIEITVPFIEIIGYTEIENFTRFSGIQLQNKRIIKLNYYNKRSVSNCSFCGIFCCKCKVTVQERILKVNKHITYREWILYFMQTNLMKWSIMF